MRILPRHSLATVCTHHMSIPLLVQNVYACTHAREVTAGHRGTQDRCEVPDGMLIRTWQHAGCRGTQTMGTKLSVRLNWNTRTACAPPPCAHGAAEGQG